MDEKSPWSETTFVAFDTETSGKYPLVAEIVEVAAAKWRNGKIIETFQTFVRPNRPMGEAVINIHHITNEMVADAPRIESILPRFDSFIKDTVLIAHHAPFDMGFIAYEYEKLRMPFPESKVLCSCLLARKAFPESVNHRLATLVSLFNVKVDQAHRALDDSKACLEVALHCMEKFGKDSSLEHIFKSQGGALEWKNFSLEDLLRHDLFGPVVEAAKKQLLLEITYKGGSRPGEPRRLTPQGLVRNPDGDYIVGLCHRDNYEKRFYFNRISSAKILD